MSNTANKTNSKKYIDTDYSDKKEPAEVMVDGTKIGTSTKKYAQILDFATLQNILTQNVGKTQSKTYVL